MLKAKQKTTVKLVKSTSSKPKSKKSMPAASAPTAPISKQSILITLLKRPKGASLEELMEATGWQRHSVHGTLSGVLKKRLGLPVITEFSEHGRMYRISDAR